MDDMEEAFRSRMTWGGIPLVDDMGEAFRSWMTWGGIPLVDDMGGCSAFISTRKAAPQTPQ